ncbi:hypothetical protein HK405_015827, partial [Cladochytrium tenue]
MIKGYIRGRSVPSLAAGLTFAGLYAYSGYGDILRLPPAATFVSHLCFAMNTVIDPAKSTARRNGYPLPSAASYLIRKNADYGVELALGSSVALVAAMGPRALRSRKMAPVSVSVLGVLGTLYYSVKLYQNNYG